MTMGFFKAIVCAALFTEVLIVAAAGASTTDNHGRNGGVQIIGQKSGNIAVAGTGPPNQNSANGNVTNQGNNNSQGVTITQSNPGGVNTTNTTGRKLLHNWTPGYYYKVDNSGNVQATQITGQKSANIAEWNWGPVNQNSANGAITSAGNGNSQGIGVSQQNGPGRKLLHNWSPGYYHVDNSGDVWAYQFTGQKSVNVAEGNSGPVNQNSANAAITSAGNGNSQGIDISQSNGP